LTLSPPRPGRRHLRPTRQEADSEDSMAKDDFKDSEMASLMDDRYDAKSMDDRYDAKSASRRGVTKSTLPRMPFKLTAELPAGWWALSAYMTPSMHTLAYVCYVLWFILGVPTIVYHTLVIPGHLTEDVYEWIWTWLAFSYCWQFVEGIITLHHHVQGFCFSSPDRGNHLDVTEYPPATAIIVAYLPNEADIIMETLAHFKSLSYAGGLEVILAYNTPRILAVEQDIVALQKTWPEFTAVKVVGSTSKCDNVNAVLPLVKGHFAGLFDSDHLPLPHSFEIAWRDLCRGVDVVQGRTKINHKYCEDFLSKVLAGEFEVRHGIEHGSRRAVYNYAVFGGSNGFWRTDTLQMIGMDPSMLTEDVDSSIRAMSYGFKIGYNHHLVSLEQPPPNFSALLKQRLRWSQGWYQVSWRSVANIFLSDFMSPRQKVGFHWMIKMCMPCQVMYSHFQSFLLVALTARLGVGTTMCLTSMWAVPQILFLVLFADLPLAWKLIYAVMMLPLMAFFMLVDLVAQMRLMIGYSTWHVTTRKNVVKDASAGHHNHVPHSPNTFRYSPSSVRLDS